MESAFKSAVVSIFENSSVDWLVALIHDSHDCPQVPNEEMAKIEKLVKDAGVVLDGDSDAELSGWVGGRVVLVPTDRPIIEWNAIAEREL